MDFSQNWQLSFYNCYILRFHEYLYDYCCYCQWLGYDSSRILDGNWSDKKLRYGYQMECLGWNIYDFCSKTSRIYQNSCWIRKYILFKPSKGTKWRYRDRKRWKRKHWVQKRQNVIQKRIETSYQWFVFQNSSRTKGSSCWQNRCR